MVASAANGYKHTDLHGCNGTPFDFHPEFSSASPNNTVPWTALQAGVGLAVEIGHFEFSDNDTDDKHCQKSPSGQTMCVSADVDFDGVPYHLASGPPP